MRFYVILQGPDMIAWQIWTRRGKFRQGVACNSAVADSQRVDQ